MIYIVNYTLLSIKRNRYLKFCINFQIHFILFVKIKQFKTVFYYLLFAINDKSIFLQTKTLQKNPCKAYKFFIGIVIKEGKPKDSISIPIVESI